MQVFVQIDAFSLETDGSGRPVLTKGKPVKSLLLIFNNKVRVNF